MKKIKLLIILSLCFSVMACGNKPDAHENISKNNDIDIETEKNQVSDINNDKDEDNKEDQLNPTSESSPIFNFYYQIDDYSAYTGPEFLNVCESVGGDIEINKSYTYDQLLKAIITDPYDDSDLDANITFSGIFEIENKSNPESKLYGMEFRISDIQDYGGDDALVYIVAEEKDNNLYLKFAADGMYRTYVTINPYGVVSTGGSSGAGDYINQYYCPDSDGNYVQLYRDETIYPGWTFYEYQDDDYIYELPVNELMNKLLEEMPDTEIYMDQYIIDDEYHYVLAAEEESDYDYAMKLAVKNKCIIDDYEEVEKILFERYDEFGLDYETVHNAFLDENSYLYSNTYNVDNSDDNEEYPTDEEIFAYESMLFGKWKLKSIEVEGDYSEPVIDTAYITVSWDEGVPVTTYKYYSGDELFEDIIFSDGYYCNFPLYLGCGNDIWCMKLDYNSDDEFEEYYLTAIDEDTIMLQHYFTFDGGPGVSYMTFTKQ